MTIRVMVMVMTKRMVMSCPDLFLPHVMSNPSINPRDGEPFLHFKEGIEEWTHL
jgi:hypothetical protein